MLDFIIPSALMGVGIAVDVSIATLSRYRDKTMTLESWTVPVTVAHVVLPAIGYYGFWGASQAFAFLAAPLGVLAFALVAVFVHEIFCEWIDARPRVSFQYFNSELPEKAASARYARLATILAVSMDALWSGPAKAAQAASAGWSGTEVFLSFLVAGFVVALVAQGSLWISTRMRSVGFATQGDGLAVGLVLGQFVEAAVLLGFGVLSLRNAAQHWLGLGSLGDALMVSAALCAVIWAAYWPRLVAVQVRELALDAGQASGGWECGPAGDTSDGAAAVGSVRR